MKAIEHVCIVCGTVEGDGLIDVGDDEVSWHCNECDEDNVAVGTELEHQAYLDEIARENAQDWAADARKEHG